MQKNKTPDYTLNAVKAYRVRKDFVSVSLPAGAKEEFKNLGVPSPALLGRELLSDKLEQLKNPDTVYFTIGLDKPLVDHLASLGITVAENAQLAFEQYAEMWEDIERQETEEQSETQLECSQETREEGEEETVKESSIDDGKPTKKRDNAVVLEEMQAAKSEETTQKKPMFTATMSEADNRAFLEEQQAELNRKRQEQEERKQKLEQEKEKRKEEEREQNRLEMRRYAESIRDRAKENQEQNGIVRAVLADPEMLAAVLSPEGSEEFTSKYGQEAYAEIVKADKERRREETKRRGRMRELEADQSELPDFMSDL